MRNSFNVDLAAECVKNIVDCTRCLICDTSLSSRSRYPCGHTACADCVEEASECLLCSTLTITSFPNQPVSDGPLTQRANNASALLDAFNVEVYKQRRLSEQLKVEKELFPNCIQAPAKYLNKRKSLNITSNKENIHSYFLGEQISPIKGSKMEKTKYIQQWLKESEQQVIQSPRKPFANLPVNQQSTFIKKSTTVKNSTPTKKSISVKKKADIAAKRTIKRPFNTSLQNKMDVSNKSSLDQYVRHMEKKDLFNTKRFKKEFGHYDKKNDKDESGIVADVDLIVIDDSQSQVIDKDKLAWFAVLETEKHSTSDSIRLDLDCSEILNYTDDVDIILPQPFLSASQENIMSSKVPFYKRSSLIQSCKLCHNGKPNIKSTPVNTKDVTITLENDSFVATINVSNTNTRITHKRSVPVQTEINDVDNFGNDVSNKTWDMVESKHLVEPNVAKMDVQSQDLFPSEDKALLEKKPNPVNNCQDTNVQNNAPNKVNLSAAESAMSDSDDDIIHSSIMEVTAEVHKSCDQLDCGVLAEIEQKELSPRSRRGNRAFTPGSSDSSEKENFDPNRAKRTKANKKDISKKNKKKLKCKPYI